ncbi:MAG: MFS transporter [Candidatus Dormibacteria bacterium]
MRRTDPRPAAGWGPTPGRPSPFVTVCGVGFLGRLSYEMARTPLTPLFAVHLGAPPEVIGLLVASVTLTGIAVKLPAGALSDVVGFRRLMLAGSLVKATGPFLYLPVFAWPQLLVVRIYHGLATALYAPPASALVARAYPRERGRRLGIYSAAENAGVVAGPVLAGAILTAAGFSLSFVASGAIGVLALALMLRVPRDAVTGPAATIQQGAQPHIGRIVRDMFTGVRGVLADPSIRLVSLVEALLWTGVGSLQAYLPLYALSVRIPVWEIGLLAGGQGAASILSRPILGRRSDRLGRRPLILGGMLLCIGAMIGVPYTANFALLLVLSTVFGLGTGMVTPATTALIGDLVRAGNYGSAMGVFGSLWDTGHAGGPIVFGLLLGILGYRGSWLLMAAVMAVASIVFLLAGARLAVPVHRD